MLVNNAGITSFGHVTEVTPEQWRKVMAVDLDSIFFAARRRFPSGEDPRMHRQHGFNLGLSGDYGLAAYNGQGGVVY